MCNSKSTFKTWRMQLSRSQLLLWSQIWTKNLTILSRRMTLNLKRQCLWVIIPTLMQPNIKKEEYPNSYHQNSLIIAQIKCQLLISMNSTRVIKVSIEEAAQLLTQVTKESTMLSRITNLNINSSNLLILSINKTIALIKIRANNKPRTWRFKIAPLTSCANQREINLKSILSWGRIWLWPLRWLRMMLFKDSYKRRRSSSSSSSSYWLKNKQKTVWLMEMDWV